MQKSSTTECGSRCCRISQEFQDKINSIAVDLMTGNRPVKTADDLFQLISEFKQIHSEIEQTTNAPDYYVELCEALDDRLPSEDKDSIFGMLNDLIDAMTNQEVANGQI